MDSLANIISGYTGFWLQILLVLICLFYGARKGGIALGLLGGIGLVILVFLFNLKPGKPPVDVMLTIIAVVSASATLQASGGLDVMLQLAEKLLRRHPKYISIIAPFTCAFLTVLCGTGHVVYTMLPIIYDIAITNNIRPERPMAASSVCAQLGIIASPVSVAVGSMIAMLAGYQLNGQELTYTKLLSITIPSTFFGVLMIGLYSWNRGKDLDNDKEFKELISDPKNKEYVYGSSQSLLDKVLPKKSWIAMWIFLAAIACVATLGAFENLRPVISAPKKAEAVKAVPNPTPSNIVVSQNSTSAQLNSTIPSTQVAASSVQKVEETKAAAPAKPKRISMVHCIQMFMLAAGAIILLTTKTNAAEVSKNEIFRSGMVAIIAVFGIAWMADTIFEAHLSQFKEILPSLVAKYPWSYAIILLIISKFVNSQAAALAIVVPIALATKVPPGIIVAFAPACYGYFILPTYPSDLAAINFDRSGTTKIGKLVINHSFILPGFIGVISSCVVGYFLTKAMGYL